MKIDIDTDKIIGWCRSHLNWIVPIVLGFGSWLTAESACATPSTGMGIWYGTLCIASGIGAIILGIRFFNILFGFDFK